MGSGGSTENTIQPTDVVGEVAKEEHDPISVQYGPNIVGLLLGYDERTERLSQAAHQLFDAISRPSNQNKQKAQILVHDVHSDGMEHGRQTVSLSEIERDLMDDVEYKAFLHKKTYGIRSMDDVDKRFNLGEMDSVCNDFKMQVEQCLAQESNQPSMPYYDPTYASLDCSQQMQMYNNCVTRKLSGLY
mmetsp:Transcript_66463/g.105643  ORF Transcript_66463/g.105643 Transcript_66463/m.105643 type:complete len:188 (+) Transcript_66463:26-589(+)|eukprot:CAMPEP_0197022742 /NCGR_PEP_ID=MMETSP1384-20130603/3559_1 /TAXON_ID=29189 /ORGANISM="Ammonia sp." /LENGTH=187 /DNA_ID=CAMNT_0042450835 /DNA_START=26 /DNA_END=589 /DNA_ORIENTATION=+